jgi:hypothetical protein
MAVKLDPAVERIMRGVDKAIAGQPMTAVLEALVLILAQAAAEPLTSGKADNSDEAAADRLKSIHANLDRTFHDYRKDKPPKRAN